MTELSETQIQNKIICPECKNHYQNNIFEKLHIECKGYCQGCRARLSGKYADGQPAKPFFKATLPMPPSVNGYWLVKPKGKYLSAINLDYIYRYIYNSIYNISRRVVMSKVPKYTKKAQEAYRKKVMTVTITINPRTEVDVYERLSEQENKSGYLKDLVKKDIEGGNHE